MRMRREESQRRHHRGRYARRSQRRVGVPLSGEKQIEDRGVVDVRRPRGRKVTLVREIRALGVLDAGHELGLAVHLRGDAMHAADESAAPAADHAKT